MAYHNTVSGIKDALRAGDRVLFSPEFSYLNLDLAQFTASQVSLLSESLRTPNSIVNVWLKLSESQGASVLDAVLNPLQQQLRKLIIIDSPFTQEHMPFFVSLKDYNLSELFVPGASIGKLLPEFLSALKPSKVVRLGISRNNIAPFIDDLVLFLNEVPRLEYLNVSGNELMDGHATKLCEAVARHPSLDTLVLRENPVKEAGMTAVAEMLKRTKVLKKLDISAFSTPNSLITCALENYNYTLTELDVGLYSLDTFRPQISRNIEICELLGWPSTHSDMPQGLNQRVMELCCCAIDIPTEVLANIVDRTTILYFKMGQN